LKQQLIIISITVAIPRACNKSEHNDGEIFIEYP